LLNIFNERWDDHPDHVALDRDKGAPVGRSDTVHASPPGGRQVVQIGRTYGNGSRHPGIDGGGYSFAPNGERTCWQMIRHAIGQARRFIYMEEQYLVSMDATRALQAALPNIQHLTILIPHGALCAGAPPQIRYRRQQFIRPLKQAAADAGTPDKVRICNLAPPGDPHTYVHSKMFIMDDQFAIIGSANCNRRGYTHDSEVMAAITDECTDESPELHFAHRLRIALWAEHLNMDTPEERAELVDGVASAVHWLAPPDGARIEPYDENADIERSLGGGPPTEAGWDRWDPDGS
jgi:phosphatidylserine/phosphatidylglycerophosphate/cardiolipin synthase-like enzyme